MRAVVKQEVNSINPTGDTPYAAPESDSRSVVVIPDWLHQDEYTSIYKILSIRSYLTTKDLKIYLDDNVSSYYTSVRISYRVRFFSNAKFRTRNQYVT